MSCVLEINNLSKNFGRLTAVDNLSFRVEKGNVYGLLGPNGSGKSTTLGMILNVVNPTAGSWKWFGEERSFHALKRIGAIIERPNFYPYLSARKNLEIVATIKDVDFSAIDGKLEIVGLIDRKDDKFSDFSLGMKQRLAIAGALLNDPEVLILDEPTNGLDPQGIIQIREIIQYIAAKGTTIILASHLLDEVEKVCSHVVVLNKGKSVYCGSVENISSELGFFELEATDMEALESALKDFSCFAKISRNERFIIALLKEDFDAAALNKQLSNKNIYLTHLVKRKQSLESQFLNIIKNQE